MRRVTKVRQEGRIKMTTKVNIGEYHSQAEYWVVMRRERVFKPA